MSRHEGVSCDSCLKVRILQDFSHKNKLADVGITHFGKFMPTVLKFLDFSITKIIREINFGDSRCAKSAILTHFAALYFAFYEIFAHFSKAEIYQSNKIQSPRNGKLRQIRTPTILKN